MESGKFYVRVIGIIFNPKERKILIGKNNGDKNYSFVDGELKYDEELNLGLKRVIKEKTGYEISNLGSIFAGLRKKEELAIYFLCEIKNVKENCQKCNFKTSNAHYKFIKIRDVLKSISKN